jgi:hypothetical protein
MSLEGGLPKEASLPGLKRGHISTQNQIVSLLPDVPSSYHEELCEKGVEKLLLC